MSIKTSFAKKVYYARKEKQYTQEQLAEIISVSVRWIQEIESGAMPGGLTTLKLIIALDLDVTDLREDADLHAPVSSVR